MERTPTGPALLVAALASSPGAATGQEAPPAFGVETFEPGNAESNVLGVESSEVPRHLEPTADAVIQRAEQAVNVRSGEELEPLVDDRWSVNLGFGLGFADRFLLDARLTMIAFQDAVPLAGTEGSVPSFATGDLRFRGKWRLVRRRPDRPYGLAFQTAVWAPTGQDGFVTDGTVRAEPRIEFDVKVGPVLGVLNAGYQIRGRREYAGYRHDDVFRWGAGLRVPIAAGFRLDGSVFGSNSPFLLADGGFNAFAHPIEALGGVGWTGRGVNVTLAGGAGLTRGVGAPQNRVLLSVGYQPDGALGREVAEARPTLFECPEGSTVADADDCPPVDTDGDTIADAEDACPKIAGIADKSGCPFVDLDGDGLDDTEDACPDEPADTRDGCPIERVALRSREAECQDCEPTAGEIVTRLEEAIFFGNDSTQFQPHEHPLVFQLRKLVEKDDTLERIVIEGHTDSRGPADYNMKLSRQRAERVREVLVEAGIASSLIDVVGKGETEPIAENDTPTGQARNRRVAIRLIRRSPPPREENSPVPPPSGTPRLDVVEFAYDRRLLLDAEDLRFLHGAVLTAQDGWQCASDDEPRGTIVVLGARRIPRFVGTRFPGWSSKVDVHCTRGGQARELTFTVVIPPFELRGSTAEGGVALDELQPSSLEVAFRGWSMPLQAKAGDESAQFVPVSASSSRLVVEPTTSQIELSADGRPLLVTPTVQRQTGRPAPRRIDPEQPAPRLLEVAVGTGMLVATRPFDQPSTGGAATLSSARFGARLLANELFSAGVFTEMGALFGANRNLFTPGIGFDASIHAPLDGAFRPFASAGVATWFPGLLDAHPAVEGAVGLDWEPVPGAGLRGGVRAQAVSESGEPLIFTGGFLGAFTSF